eukprot:403369213
MKKFANSKIGFSLVGVAALSAAMLYVSQLQNGIDEIGSASTNLIKITEGLTIVPGAVLSFESHNGEGSFWRHEDYYVHRHGYSNDAPYKNDASFTIENCFNGFQGVSFRSVNYPDHYIRHHDYRLSIWRVENEVPYYQDTCFVQVPGLANSQAVSFRSYNYPNSFIRHADNHLRIADYEDSNIYREDATWYPRVGFITKVDYVEIDYIQDQMKVLEQPPLFTEKKRFHNGSPTEQTYGFSGETSVKNTKSYERTDGFELTVGASYTMKVSEVVVSEESTISFEMKTTHSVTYGESEETTKTFKFDNPLTVPGYKTYESQVYVRRMLLDIPYIATVHFEGLPWVTTFRGEYKGVESFQSDIDVRDVTPQAFLE